MDFKLLKTLFGSFLTVGLVISLTSGCQKKSGDSVIEDSRSATNYMGKGLRSLTGTYRDSKEISSPDQYAGPPEDPYLPLNPNDLYQNNNGSATDLVGDADYARNESLPLPMDPVNSSSAVTPEQFQDPEALHLGHIFQHIQFDTDDYTIRGRDSQTTVTVITAFLKEHPEYQLYIEGHCDERASAAYNLALGTRRSNAVKSALVKNGIAIDRLFTISYGKERPIALGHSSQDWQKNRRVQFKIIAITPIVGRPLS